MNTSNSLSRRQFIATTAAATAAISLPLPLKASAAPLRTPFALDLNGPWQFAREGTEDFQSAVVPGCVHTDLLALGKIPDPFYRKNEHDLQWVGEANWIYKRKFQVPAELIQRHRVLLRCEGLDTLAAVRLNGQELGRADNMFRLWEFDVKSALKPGENKIEIHFESPFPTMREKNAQHPMYEWIDPPQPKGRAWVRKEPCSFGWDWGPVLPSSGIWKNIGLVAFDTARLADVSILQEISAELASLTIDISAETAEGAAGALYAEISIAESAASSGSEGRKIAGTKVDLQNGKGRVAFTIKHPKLWWPAGMGAQPLYHVGVSLIGPDGGTLDRAAKRIGLRTLKMLPPDAENPLRFEANGIPFFAKGANWIPADSFANRVTPEILRRYVADAVAVNMNTLRFWGGGYYEEEALYDACDEMGICVWLDFKFACSSYPAFEDTFMENVRLEARDNIRRLRHHPCIAVWCGNNEIGLMTGDIWSEKSMGRADYDKLFKKLIADQVSELAPQANYVSGSPDCGDTHYWKVWHGPKMFDAYRSLTGFMSEFGYQSFPEPKTVAAFTSEEDRASVLSEVMKWHQRSGTQGIGGNEQILDMLQRYFRPAKDFEATLWLSQMLQAYGIKIGAEFWRQSMPKSMGCVYWQYNDIWPGMSWSSVDYFGRWKALHYWARHFYAPVMVSGIENLAAGSIDLFVTSDELKNHRGNVLWTATDAGGKKLEQGGFKIDIPARQSRKVQTLDLSAHCRRLGAANVLTWLKLEVDGKVVSENLVLFDVPKQIKLADPQIKTAVKQKGGAFHVTLKAEKPALWTWLTLDSSDARYSDNFVHLAAGIAREIIVRPKTPMPEAEFLKSLRVRSLFDICTMT